MEQTPSKTKNYVFAQSRAIAPEHEEAALAQIISAHRFRNALVEFEHIRRAAVDAAIQANYPQLATLDAQLAEIDAAIEVVYTRIKKRNAQERRRRTSPEDKTELDELKARRKATYAERKVLRKHVFADKKLFAKIEKQHKVRRKKGLRCQRRFLGQQASRLGGSRIVRQGCAA